MDISFLPAVIREKIEQVAAEEKIPVADALNYLVALGFAREDYDQDREYSEALEEARQWRIEAQRRAGTYTEADEERDC